MAGEESESYMYAIIEQSEVKFMQRADSFE